MILVNKLQSLKNLGVGEFRILGHIHFGNFEHSISVQASSFHYCRPRQTIPLDEYTHFEVMLNVPFKDIPQEWEQFNDGEIYSFVPKMLVEHLIFTLDKKYKMN